MNFRNYKLLCIVISKSFWAQKTFVESQIYLIELRTSECQINLKNGGISHPDTDRAISKTQRESTNQNREINRIIVDLYTRYCRLNQIIEE